MANLDIIVTSDEEYYLSRLSLFLNYELSTFLLYILSLLAVVALIPMIIAAIFFTPYMLFALYKSNRWGWIVAFLILVILPFIITFIIGLVSGYLLALTLIPFGLFYFYCFMLRIVVGDWIDVPPEK